MHCSSSSRQASLTIILNMHPPQGTAPKELGIGRIHRATISWISANPIPPPNPLDSEPSCPTLNLPVHLLGHSTSISVPVLRPSAMTTKLSYGQTDTVICALIEIPLRDAVRHQNHPWALLGHIRVIRFLPTLCLARIKVGFVPPRSCVRRSTSMSSQALNGEQARLYQEEQIIEVNEHDQAIGPISKGDGHLNKLGPLLHRAFSVFLFDTAGRLLLQQRASEKITFPDTWTNTCCSHPLFNDSELGKDINDDVMGCKRAAVRKLRQELGAHLVPADLLYLTRVHYIANSSDQYGEHEIDYIFLTQKDVQLGLNPNEVRDVRYVTAQGLRGMMETTTFTPWSKAIIDRFLFKWWDNLDRLDTHVDSATIHRLGRVTG